jgi:hypothetical protein
LDFPVGRSAITDPNWVDKFPWLLRHTKPSDYVFQADGSEIYFPLSLRNPTYVYDLVTAHNFQVEQVEHVIVSLSNHSARYVLWSHVLDLPFEDSWLSVFQPLREYLRTNYRAVHTFSDGDQVWERKTQARELPAGHQP